MFERPLATVVIGGMLASAPLTLLVFPGMLLMWIRGPDADARPGS